MTNDGYVAMQVIQAVNGWLFGGPVLILLFGIHVYFTIYTGENWEPGSACHFVEPERKRRE